MWEMMLEIIRETANSHCPVKEMKIMEDTPKWITKEIISELNLKDYLFKKAKKLNTVESWNLFEYGVVSLFINGGGCSLSPELTQLGTMPAPMV